MSWDRKQCLTSLLDSLRHNSPVLDSVPGDMMRIIGGQRKVRDLFLWNSTGEHIVCLILLNTSPASCSSLIPCLTSNRCNWFDLSGNVEEPTGYDFRWDAYRSQWATCECGLGAITCLHWTVSVHCIAKEDCIVQACFFKALETLW